MLNTRNLGQTDDRLLFKLLMENENISKMVAKYLTKSLDLREFLIEKHQQLDQKGRGYIIISIACSSFYKKLYFRFSINYTNITFVIRFYGERLQLQ